MPEKALISSLDYDRFEYKYYDEDPLSLDGAAKKAAQLRDANPDYVYRIVPADDELTEFRVEKVPRIQVYVEFLTNAAQRYARLLSHLHRFSPGRRSK